MGKGTMPEVDEAKTGNEIAALLIAERLKEAGVADPAEEAEQLVRNLTGGKYPLALVQRGRLLKLLDTLEKLQGRESAVAELLNQAGELLKKVRAEASLPPSKR